MLNNAGDGEIFHCSVSLPHLISLLERKLKIIYVSAGCVHIKVERPPALSQNTLMKLLTLPVNHVSNNLASPHLALIFLPSNHPDECQKRFPAQ